MGNREHKQAVTSEFIDHIVRESTDCVEIGGGQELSLRFGVKGGGHFCQELVKGSANPGENVGGWQRDYPSFPHVGSPALSFLGPR